MDFLNVSDGRLVSLEVALGERSYPIYIGAGLIEGLSQVAAAALRGKQCFVISDDRVSGLYRQAITRDFEQADLALHWLSVAPGESSKSQAAYAALCEAILAKRPERGDLVIALGGGVVGDLAGFVAATLLRGLDFIQVPTTLLAQVDSSVGGKTGINSQQGKNLIGTFYQPKLVLIDTASLNSLSPRARRAGYAEILKYGLIHDADFFAFLEREGEAVLNLEPEALNRAIATSCRIKAEIVAADEREAGRRALLNLGHTFGHALEALAGYDGRLLHGEAVAIGIQAAYRLSRAMGLVSEPELARVVAHIRALGLPLETPRFLTANTSADALLNAMTQDKKVSDGKLHFVLPRGIGAALVTAEVPAEALRSVIDWLSA